MTFQLAPLKLNSVPASNAFWQAALSLASASELTYRSHDVVRRMATDRGGFSEVVAIEGDAPGFMAFGQDTAVIAVRGTVSLVDWLSNLNADSDPWNSRGRAHDGFLIASKSIEPQIAEFLASRPTKRIWFAGHSRGGAIAAILACNLATPEIPTDIYTFGQPLFANDDAATSVDAQFGQRYQRFVNDDDIVAIVPPGYTHCENLTHFDTSGGIRKSLPGSLETIARSRVISEAEFEKLQRQLRDVSADSENYLDKRTPEQTALESSSVTKSDLADITAKGLIPGIADHDIGRYVNLIRRHVSRPEVSNESIFAPSISIAKQVLSGVTKFQPNSPLGTIQPGRDFVDRDDKDVLLPVLIRLRSAAPWLAPQGIRVSSQIGTIVSASGTADALKALESHPDVISATISRDAGVQELSTAVPFVGADDIHSGVLTNPTSSLPVEEKGDRALIGLIDSGIDILHEAFRDADGNSRILAVWDQLDNSTEHTPNKVDPLHFPQDYGRLYMAADLAEFKTEDATATLRDQRPIVGGHGTHVAGIAAGRATTGGPSSGVAPEARLVVVIPNMRTNPEDPPSLGYSKTHADGIDFLRRVYDGGSAVIAEALPMAVNVSLGMNAGAHDGSSPLETAFDQISLDRNEFGRRVKGFAIVKSAGNEFGQSGHVRNQLFEGENELTWTTTNKSRHSDYIEVWFDSSDRLEFTLVDPLGRESDVVSEAAPTFKKTLGGVLWDIDLEPVHDDNGDSLLRITLTTSNRPIPEGLWRLRILGVSISSDKGFIDAWVERDGARAVRFQNSDNKMTLSIPGTARTVICVAACHASEPLKKAEFSSVGRTRDNRAKPDLIAPGVSISSARAGTLDENVADSGTSMAAPLVTGVLALAMSYLHKKGPEHQLNAVQFQRALVRTLANDSNPHRPEIGHGRLDAKAFFEAIL
ncbi:MAG: S8 family serine peptidase [Alphaproteobacteria bacterium]|nr:S8 family serine peptidase [Alphaproteobacteria bacterium]